MTILYFFRAASGVGWHRTDGPDYRVFYVLLIRPSNSGNELQGQSAQLKAGDTIITPGNHWHHHQCQGHEFFD